MRRISHAGKQLLSGFEEAISQLSEVPCFVCKKLLYPKQCRNFIVTANITVIPVNSTESIICCDRRTKKIEKNQCSSNAFWNNMTVSPIREELASLSEIELKLISRIKPFVKVLSLGGRYGQQGFKGQAVLFAQQI